MNIKKNARKFKPNIFFSIILLKRLVTWFYQLKLNKTSIKLKSLREEKKKIIEKVMDTETYKVELFEFI